MEGLEQDSFCLSMSEKQTVNQVAFGKSSLKVLLIAWADDGACTVDLDAEQTAFDREVKIIEEWWKTPRQAQIKRFLQICYLSSSICL